MTLDEYQAAARTTASGDARPEYVGTGHIGFTPKARSERAKVKKHLRKWDADHYLDGLLVKQDWRCHWCARDILRWQVAKDFPQAHLGEKGLTIFWMIGDQPRSAGRATLDHLREVDECRGPQDMVAACAECNFRRGKQQGREAYEQRKARTK